MPAELAADRRGRLGERGLHEDVPHAALDGLPARLTDRLGNAARRAQVVDHRGTGIGLQHAAHHGGEQEIAALYCPCGMDMALAYC